ncbi:hypothetical protein KC945_01450, partial [Candidatus Saccharibacteria bacterium]|nr:hypothetical protein [Candidatus Saccharibacteria bacterium]
MDQRVILPRLSAAKIKQIIPSQTQLGIDRTCLDNLLIVFLIDLYFHIAVIIDGFLLIVIINN